MIAGSQQERTDFNKFIIFGSILASFILIQIFGEFSENCLVGSLINLNKLQDYNHNFTIYGIKILILCQ